MTVKMGDLINDYQAARTALHLDAYDEWLVECLVGLLCRHDRRVKQHQRRAAHRRKSAAMRARQAAGRRMSRIAPFGWRVDPACPWRLQLHAEEQQVRDLILQQAAAGQSFRAIARGLDVAGIRCRTGRGWSHQCVAAILRRTGWVLGKKVADRAGQMPPNKLGKAARGVQGQP